MLVDVRLAMIQADYKRERLARIYGKDQKRHEGVEQATRSRNLRRPALSALLSLLNR